jgi:hypothetical protein
LKLKLLQLQEKEGGDDGDAEDGKGPSRSSSQDTETPVTSTSSRPKSGGQTRQHSLKNLNLLLSPRSSAATEGGEGDEKGKGKDISGFMSMKKKSKSRPKVGVEEFTISGPSQFRKEETAEQPAAVTGKAVMGNLEAVEVVSEYMRGKRGKVILSPFFL